MAQTKADRQAAAKKAAATRERNQIRSSSKQRGRKAASSRRLNEARENLEGARKAAGSIVSGTTGAARHVGDAAVNAGKSVVSRVGIGSR